MKYAPYLLLGSLLCSGTALFAQTENTDTPRHGPHGRRGPGLGRIHPIIRVLDADADRTISPAELANAPAALRALDANKDGTVTIDELRPPRPADAPTPPADAPARPPRGEHIRRSDPIMLALDADSNGSLSANEIANAAASLKALDANADGALSLDELRPLPPTK